MHLTCHCPACGAPIRAEISVAPAQIVCVQCGHARAVSLDAIVGGQPRQCLGCGNGDLWRQKDFPQRVGILLVVLGAILSSIAWGYHRPILALSILGAFALVDMALFWVMPDVLVCYRCRARHRLSVISGAFSPYSHELGERYRQERLRVEQRSASGSSSRTS